MKVLSQNNKSWAKKFTCQECKSKLEVAIEDLYVANHAVFYAGETWEPEVQFDCAVCKSSNVITALVPSGIRAGLISKAAAKRR